MRTLKSIVEYTIHALVIVIVVFNAFAPVTAVSASSADTNAPLQEKANIETSTTADEVEKTASSTKFARGIKLVTPPVIQQEPITVQIKATPESLKPDGKVAIHWAIDGISKEDIQGLTLMLILPEGFKPTKGEKGVFDPQNNNLTIELTSLNG
jgi:hypothetical protein